MFYKSFVIFKYCTFSGLSVLRCLFHVSDPRLSGRLRIQTEKLEQDSFRLLLVHLVHDTTGLCNGSIQNKGASTLGYREIFLEALLVLPLTNDECTEMS